MIRQRGLLLAPLLGGECQVSDFVYAMTQTATGRSLEGEGRTRTKSSLKDNEKKQKVENIIMSSM